jgi:hypothetical protein
MSLPQNLTCTMAFPQALNMYLLPSVTSHLNVALVPKLQPDFMRPNGALPLLNYAFFLVRLYRSSYIISFIRPFTGLFYRHANVGRRSLSMWLPEVSAPES